MFDNLGWRSRSAWGDSTTISSEIFGVERMRQHARSLAESQITSNSPLKVVSVIYRLDENARLLLEVYREISAAVANGRPVTPAAEWLIDNYHLVEVQIRQTRADLPAGFYRQLPKLASGPLAGHPRIFGLAWAYVAHTDSQFQLESLTDFVNEYQQVQPLRIGELWAVAISLRLILIENLRRVAERIHKSRKERLAADAFADALFQRSDKGESLDVILSVLGEPQVTQQFAVQLIQRARDQTGVGEAALSWLRTKLEATGDSFETAVSDELHRQGAANVTIRNIVTSLRLISDVNWDIWFDGVSLVDKTLRTDATYTAMDFKSRTLYRTSVENLSRGSNHDEISISQMAVGHREGVAGAYLIGNEQSAFRKQLGYQPPLMRRLREGARSLGLAGYLSAALAISAATLIFGFFVLNLYGVRDAIPILLLLAVPASTEFGLSVLNWMVTQIFETRIIPGFAFRTGVSPEFKTLVVIPTLLTSRDDIDELVDRLEVHFLSNTDEEIYFALATDWTDSSTQTRADDDGLLKAAMDGIKALNERHGAERFYLLHRHRQWNAQQNRWIGWERKRGKLHELNRLLRGAFDTSFTTLSGILPSAIRYVITLDSDTKLPRDAARRLIGKMAHPLNHPVFDASLKRITKGYAVLQPRVTPSLPVGHHGSTFQRIFSTTRGVDPYVFAVSDVYQDLFGEGSFAGKGIYDIDAFEMAMAGKVPENTMLSHDLFEGIFARAGLVTDIELVEEFPERYGVAASRDHRWTRGDWQLLPWIVGFTQISLPALGRWKMIDNLRRPIVSLTTMFALFAGWILLPSNASIAWTATLLILRLLPVVLPILISGFNGGQGNTMRSNFGNLSLEAGHAIVLWLANIAFLAHHAALTADAIVRTLYRLLVSRKKLLEWTTAAQSNASHQSGVLGSYVAMAPSVIAGTIALGILFARGPYFWVAIIPVALLWLAAPLAATLMSKPRRLFDSLDSSPVDRHSLRLVARRTWRFFDQFVTAQDNMLPPDNFQETPSAAVARRTSPTNIGLYLLSTASARQFGWIGLGETISRIEATISTLKRLEKFRGHLYNWYDTGDLHILEPQYVSSVDSGNLAGHLIALSHYCREWMLQPGDPRNSLSGITDALDLILEALAELPDDRKALRPIREHLKQQIATLRSSLDDARAVPEMIALRMVTFSLQANNIATTVARLAEEAPTDGTHELSHWADALRKTIESHFSDAPLPDANLKMRLETLADDCAQIAFAMDFKFLLDPQRLLLSIGYRVPENTRDENCYDMLASEARLASYFAVAKGDLRTRHWFRLGRSVTAVRGGAALMSWSGSMFEYLMPSLVMRAPADGLLDQTAQLIVNRQISYANVRSVPWGISESAYNARDLQFSYQYSNFGVPGLGLKRGLSDNLVIAPYATGLAAMVAPRAAAQNYRLLTKVGARGAYGYYEALDYTASRLRKDQPFAVVQAYFAHHQGMTIVAILNALKSGDARDHFHADPAVRATELLLQERAPRNIPHSEASSEQMSLGTVRRDEIQPALRHFVWPNIAAPATHVLSNGQYNVMLTAAGGGYSTCNGVAITRWREDLTTEQWGAFIYLRDLQSDKKWSAGFLPTTITPAQYSAVFSEEKAEFLRRDSDFTTLMECIVSPEDNAEARHITITNGNRSTRDIEFTSFCELVLAPAAADNAHPAFSKLFIETEYVPELEAVFATRRRRSPNEAEIWVAQFLVVQGEPVGDLEYETDRWRFIGRGRTARSPNATTSAKPLSATVGAVLDPVIALRHRLKVGARRQVRCTVWTVVASSREALLDLVDRYRQVAAYDRAMMLSWTQAQIQLRHLSIGTEEANTFQTLAGHLIYANSVLRDVEVNLVGNLGQQSLLWSMSISGDRPIFLLRIDNVVDISVVQQALQAFEYWKAKQITADLVILNDRMSSYVQDLQTAIEVLVRKFSGPGPSNQVFMVRADLLATANLRALSSAARIVIYARRGSLTAQVNRLASNASVAMRASVVEPRDFGAPVATDHLAFFNGFGGFAADGREYVSVLNARRPTPAPWINVVANPQFGFHASADGCGYTWLENARDNQLTPWSNDPVSNTPSEVFYVRDDVTGVLMSPTLLPINSTEGTHIAAHGFGYTRYERRVHGLNLELLQCVALDDPVKLSRLRITNLDGRSRKLSITFYADLVLGGSRAASAPFVITSIDPNTGAMLARNPWRNDDARQVAFVDMAGIQTHWTGDRKAFLGPFGTLAAPRALTASMQLSNTTGAGIDPCCALQIQIELAPFETRNVIISFGAAPSHEAATAVVTRSRARSFDEVLAAVHSYWDTTLNAVQVKTPDPSFNVMMNGWLQYQTLSCRLWARSGFYQASGAFGFRDQLQDCLALLTTRPELARAHLLRASARQFVEGDFQHWWLPETGMGVRTHISDDTVWLAHGVNRYVLVTGDTKILDEQIAFLDGQMLAPGEHDAFFLPSISHESGSLYEHCARALDLGLTKGEHGLPLFGTGDWNDGMNRVGEGGKGESVWLAWFLYDALISFGKTAAQRGDDARVAKWASYAALLKIALSEHAWDGKWWRRGYFDDGTVLGSSQSESCQIDAIAQSWSVISGAADKDRAAMAMEQSYRHLVRTGEGLALLFTPPFDKGVYDPGYIKAYPPGIRENGGQYTHGAIWSIFAFAKLNQTERAEHLFSMLNPINHSNSEAAALKYRVEPYVVAADIASVAPHVGRGGWTWYTGSAAMLYRAGLEAILGVERRGDTVHITPCVPTSWNEITLTFLTKSAKYEVTFLRDMPAQKVLPKGVLSLGTGGYSIALNDDGATHQIKLVMPARSMVV